MDPSLIHASTRTQAQLRLGSDKANNFVGIPYAVEYGTVLHILQVPQKVSGDVWHHCDQILTYTSGVILGNRTGYRRKKVVDEKDKTQLHNKHRNTSETTTSNKHNRKDTLPTLRQG